MQLKRLDPSSMYPLAFAEQAYEQAISTSAPGPIPFDGDEEETEPDPWIENEDYSKTVTLSTGVVCTFRDMTGGDLKFVETLNGGNIDRTMRLACRLCVKWGDRDSVTPPQLDKVRAKDMMLISKTIESFLS